MKQLFFYITLLACLQMTAQKTLDKLLKQYNTQSVPYISVEETRSLQLNGDIVLLDAREMNEFEVSKIPSATYIGYSQFSSEEISTTITDKDTPIIVYCSLGIRSEEIGEKLQKVGFTNVKNLYGGIFEWKNKDYPVANLLEKETDSVHTCTKSWSKWLTKGIKVYE